MSFIRWAAHLSHMILPVAAIGLLAAGPLTAAGQGAYPNRPVKIVVPISPGSGTDVVARMVAERLGKALGQPFTVENKPGADGNIGSDYVAKAWPDGYVLGVIASSPLVMNPAIYKMPFDPMKDLAPITNLAHLGLILGVQPSLPVKNVQELIAHANATERWAKTVKDSNFTVKK